MGAEADETNKQYIYICEQREIDTDLNAIKMFFNAKMNFKISIFPCADNKIKMRNGTQVDRTRRTTRGWGAWRKAAVFAIRVRISVAAPHTPSLTSFPLTSLSLLANSNHIN